ncbi:DUF4429 domain-containing protein [Streptomyces chromofuscus]|uniref:DUF4429 domain-containing protein n=1 Tax=Streptomyces chromofuscus TaxID=42881 RepID=A0A7M2TGG2_STRCW|nr:DUF4429 domain-containing protein [Streptomyces chromofuscus]QOV46828.1 DUF4429 domain-containing protein [Streptomyces chromofuscus]GGT13834.1 hypothetical protein GCM10010254_37960 [Streptomyces chromofuscus]
MAEIIQKDGTWVFDGDALRLTPGRDKSVGLLRKALGELVVPLRALAGISFEQGRRSGRLRLRLRDGADPLLHATGGRLGEPHDPYQLVVEPDRYGVAEYVVDEVRRALMLDQVPPGPVAAYLLPGPSVPVSAAAGDGTASFDGEQVRLEWNWKTEDAKSSAGPRTLAVGDIAAVEWHPAAGLENGYLRFTVRNAPTKAPPKYDPNAVELWGFRKDPLMALVAAAVQARLPHPAAPGPAAAPEAATLGASAPQASLPGTSAREPEPAASAREDDHDALLRRLRELGELHHAGVLTDEEFTLAKQAILKRM